MARATWAVDVRSADSGEQLFELNAGKLMMPASNMKVVTLAAAAETLGWDFRFTTTLETLAPVEEGVLRGDLFIRGTGDPTINSRDGRAAAVLDEWAAALHAAGVHEIAGRIIGDDQAFDDDWLGNGWAWDYLQFGYAAPVGALQIDENVARLIVSPGTALGEPATITMPAGSGLTLLNRAVTGAEGSEATLDFKRHPDRAILEISGSVPMNGTAATRSIAVVNPTLFFAQTLKDCLIARGIPVHGGAADFDDVAAEFAGTTTPRHVVATTQSPPLSQLATVLMKVSQNLYAEALLKAVGAAGGGVGTTAGGRSRLRQTLGSWGIPGDSYLIADGSGLSRLNYVSARMVTTVLERMFRDRRHHDRFLATLPIAGRDGTVASRMRRTRAEGNALAKTGSILNVRSLSGYVRTRDDETLVFSILANDFVIPPATVNWIVDLAVETLANFARRR